MADSEDWEARFVVLEDGMVVPADAYRLLLNLEDRGFTLEQEGTSTLRVRPSDRLTAADCVQLRRWKWHLLMLLRYCHAPARVAQDVRH